jgi:hypothetical protein
MTILERNPTNPNPLHPNKFLLAFSRLPDVQYFCQSLNVPGISLNEVAITNPFVDIYAPGEKAIYDLLSVTFIIDEELKAWAAVHDWIRAMTFPKEFEEYRQLEGLAKKYTLQSKIQPQYSDASLTILSSSNNPYIRFKFYDVFPTTLSTFVLDTKQSPSTVLTADVTFRYNYYDIERLY